jgi:hypothetical protein
MLLFHLVNAVPLEKKKLLSYYPKRNIAGRYLSLSLHRFPTEEECAGIRGSSNGTAASRQGPEWVQQKGNCMHLLAERWDKGETASH